MRSEQRSGRERLLEAAGVYFGSEPYGEVSVSDLLAKSGVQAPTLYHHFGDKEGLFVAWAETAFESIGLQITRGLSSAVTTLEGLTAFTKVLAEPDQIDIMRVLRDADRCRQPQSKDRIYAGYFRGLYEPLCELLLKGIERSEIRADSLGHMASSFVLGALSVSPKWGVPGSAPSDDPSWWPSRFLEGFGVG